MLTAIATVVLTFVLTGLAANRLVQRWQYRNWILQQRMLDAQERQKSLQAIFEDLANLASKRHNKMRMLLSSLRSHSADKVDERLQEYGVTLSEWNERLNPISATLTLHLGWNFTWRLQKQIQPAFRSLGRDLERLSRLKAAGSRLSTSELRQAQHRLDQLQGTLFAFNRDMLRYLFDKRAELYREQILSPDT